jgi:HEAT repeat protein
MQESTIEQLREQCRTGNPAQQAPALQDLVDMKAYVAVPEILELLKSPDDAIRFSAAEALGDLGAKEIESVGPALINLLVDPEGLVRSGAVDSLGILGYTPARKQVESLLLNDPAPMVRAAAAETLGDLSDRKAIESLKLSMQDPDETVRAYAANSLGLLGTPELLPQLQLYIESEECLKVKAELLAAKYRLGAAADINQFLNLLENADEDLATVMLNILADLIERKTPSTIAVDAGRICEILAVISQRFLILGNQAQNLIVALKR